jgi:hypothetical protein
MATDMPAALIDEPAQPVAETAAPTPAWAETALTALFAAAAVLFISFVAVITGLA